LPGGKALLDLAGRPMLEHVLARAAAVPGVDQVVPATTVSPEDGALAEVARAANVACVRGKRGQMCLDRFHAGACRALPPTPSSDHCRLSALAPEVLRAGRERVLAARGRADYVSNVHRRPFPMDSTPR
jgi:spore coat polysaccharide biosynthesis protein SpsF